MYAPSIHGYKWIQANPTPQKRTCPPVMTTRIQQRVANRFCTHGPGKMVTIRKLKSLSERAYLLAHSGSFFSSSIREISASTSLAFNSDGAVGVVGASGSGATASLAGLRACAVSTPCRNSDSQASSASYLRTATKTCTSTSSIATQRAEPIWRRRQSLSWTRGNASKARPGRRIVRVSLLQRTLCKRVDRADTPASMSLRETSRK